MKPNTSIGRREILLSGTAGVLAGSSALPTAASAVEEKKRVLRFAHLTDTHVQPQRSAGEGFATCLEHVQNQDDPAELIVFGGDNVMNVDGRGRDSADEQVKVWNDVVTNTCKLPHKYVIGNHDILALDPVDGKKWAVDTFEMENRYYTFDQAGWRFIILESTSPQEGGGYKGELDNEQFEWMAGLIADTPDTTPICIISHIPILAACAYFDGDNEESRDWCVPGAWMHIDARKIKDVFYKHPNVKLCLSGHIHLADTVEYLEVKYACNGAVSGGWWGGAYQEFSPGYAMVDLYSDGSSSVDYIEYGWQARD